MVKCIKVLCITHSSSSHLKATVANIVSCWWNSLSLYCLHHNNWYVLDDQCWGIPAFLLVRLGIVVSFVVQCDIYWRCSADLFRIVEIQVVVSSLVVPLHRRKSRKLTQIDTNVVLPQKKTRESTIILKNIMMESMNNNIQGETKEADQETSQEKIKSEIIKAFSGS